MPVILNELHPKAVDKHQWDSLVITRTFRDVFFRVSIDGAGNTFKISKKQMQIFLDDRRLIR